MSMRLIACLSPLRSSCTQLSSRLSCNRLVIAWAGSSRRLCSAAAVQDSERRVQLGNHRNVLFPSEQLQLLEDCNNQLGNTDALRRKLSDQGYLFIRGFHRREDVLAARLAVLNFVRSSPGQPKLDADANWESGVLDSRCGAGCIPFMEGKNDITHSDTVLNVLEGKRAKDFFCDLFGEPARSFDFKWLRGMHSTGYTGAHVDNVYMSRGSKRLLTCWQPFGDVSVEMGTLAVCEGSHCLPRFNYFQETYGNLDVEEVNLHGSGWFTEDPSEITQFGGQWRTADFQAGDVLIFTMRTVHMSTANLTNLMRISCDTRWQPLADPADARYVGNFSEPEQKFGVHSPGEKDVSSLTMDDLRRKWHL